LRKFIHIYDRDRDFAINYEELLNFVLTRKNEDLRNIVLDKEGSINIKINTNKNNESINSEVEDTFVNLLLKELDLVEELAKIAEELRNSKDFTTYEAFLAVDGKNQRYINEDSLLNFLQKNGYDLSQNETREIVFRLDNDADGKVSYDEFQEIFFPIRLGSKPISYNNYSTKDREEEREGEREREINTDSLKYSSSNFYNTGMGSNSVSRGNRLSPTFREDVSAGTGAGAGAGDTQEKEIEKNFDSEGNEEDARRPSAKKDEKVGKSETNNSNINQIEKDPIEDNEISRNPSNSNSNTGNYNSNYNNTNTKDNYNSNYNSNLNFNSNSNLNSNSNFSENIKNTYNYTKNNNNNDILNKNTRENFHQSQVDNRSKESFYPRSPLRNEFFMRSIPNKYEESKEKFFSSMSSITGNIPDVNSVNCKINPIQNARSYARISSPDRDVLNMRASRNTYTSPIRREESFLSNNIGVYKYFSPERNINNVTGAASSSVNFYPRSVQRPVYQKSPIRSTITRSPIRSRVRSPVLERSLLSSTSSSANAFNLKPSGKGSNLATFFNDLIVLDANCEVFRESLAMKTDANMKDLFTLFDFSCRNSISLIDFKEVLKGLDIYASITDLKLVFKRFDVNLDGSLE
jgi:Ca2+-binding EF-hand superfamily protein